MSQIEQELARRRHKAAAAEIQRRHRQRQADAARLSARVFEETSPSGVHPEFAREIGRARKRAEAARKAPLPRADLEVVVSKLRSQGKLPPQQDGNNVGYEPTPEEVLGDLAAPSEPFAPDGVEDSPSADDVLSGWGPDATAESNTESAEPPAALAPAAAERTGLARPGPVVQATRKRNRSK